MHHADFQSICARSTDIRERENKVVGIHSERMTEKKNIASSSSSILFNHVHTISNYNSRFSNLSVSHFPFFSSSI